MAARWFILHPEYREARDWGKGRHTAGLIWSMRAALVKPELTSEIARAFCRRIITGQSLYAFGAAPCIFNTYWSIGFIVLVQLNYAIGPDFPPRVREPARA